MDQSTPVSPSKRASLGGPLTKRELKQLRRLEKLDQKTQEGSRNTIKWIILAASALLFIAFFGFLIFLAKQNPSQEEIVLSNSGWAKGAQNPKVTLVEFADFQCSACKAYHPIIQGLLSTYKDKSFKLILKHFPLTSSHKNALPSAMAAEAAGEQGKFFEMHDLLYKYQSDWADLPLDDARKKFISYAQELKLDEESFRKDLDRKDLEDKIRAQQEEGIKNGVNATPTFFLNGKIIQNPRSVDDFKKLIDQELK